MWVVDTCVLIDVLEDDPDFGRLSAAALTRRLPEGLVVSPVTFVELSPAFDGSRLLQEEFLAGVGSTWAEPWTEADSLEAHRAWNVHIARRRAAVTLKRPIADVLIGAFACRFDGLITRNPADFRANFPSLRLSDPTRPDDA